MEHIDIPESCKPHRVVPYLGHASKYDLRGFEGFPERFSVDSEKLVSTPRMLEWPADHIESLIQEWFWFRLMHEFARACGIKIDLNDFITDNPSGSGRILTTRSLFDDIARRVAVKELKVAGLSIGLRIDDVLDLPHDPNQDSIKQIFDLVIARYLANRNENDLASQVQEHHDLVKTVMGKLHTGEQIGENRGDSLSIPILCDRLASCRVIYERLSRKLDSNNPLRQPTSTRKSLARCMAYVQKATGFLQFQQNPLVCNDILLSVDILGYSISQIIWVIYKEHIDAPESANHMFSFEERMLSQNWCLSRSSAYGARLFLPSAYIASLLPSYEGESHQGCTTTKCVKRDSNLNSAKHHATCSGDCHLVEIDESRLIEIMNSGGIPALRLTSSQGQLTHDMIDCSGRKFVAISHVWTHGLGNPLRNELPFCQVKFLSEAVSACAGHDALIWIDTLSVPISRTYKDKAILQLRYVYSEATKVLVIDKKLMQIGDDQVEQILHLLGSEWAQRLWTLQEGRLAKELVVQFKDKAIAVTELQQDLLLYPRYSQSAFFNMYMELAKKVKTRFLRQENMIVRFQDLMEDLARRSVTVSTDEPICIATLLNLSLEKFASMPTMTDIYRSLQTVPQNIIFQRQPRINRAGLGWAPSTFLETEFSSFRDDAPGKITPRGLHVERDCIILQHDISFQESRSYSPERYIINTSDGLSYIVKPDMAKLDRQSARQIPKPAIIWRRRGNRFESTSSAVLVSDVTNEEGVLYCRFEMLLVGWRTDGYSDMELNMFGSLKVADTLSGDFFSSREFCIG